MKKTLVSGKNNMTKISGKRNNLSVKNMKGNNYMNEKEIQQLIKQMRQQFGSIKKGSSEEEIDQMILDVFFRGYCEDKMSREDLTTLTSALGYEVKDEILDQIEKEKKEGK